MSTVSRFLACASVLALCGCASTSAPTTAVLRGPVSVVGEAPEGSAYGLYLAGRAALRSGANSEASAYFAQAARLSGSDEAKDQALVAAVLGGDVARAATLAPTDDSRSPGAVRLGRMVQATDAMARGRGKQAFAALSGEPVGFPHRAAAALLKPWTAAAAGDWAAATAEPELKADRLAYTLGSLSRAELLERAHRYDEAEAVLKSMSGPDVGGGIFVEAHGEFLERRGRKADALALYDAALAAAPSDARLMEARARAAAGRPPPRLPEIRTGAAQALVGAAASSLLLKQAELSIIYLRLALHLAPDNDEAWMMLGDTLAATDDADAARAAYGKVPPASPDFVDARVRMVATLDDDADKAQALAMARETVRLAPGSVAAQIMLADVLRTNKQYAESAEVLDAVIGSKDARADGRLYYLRAIALDKAGRWMDAERDLQAGLRLSPDDAQLLNYLGYTWIARGERIDEAMGMIQKALLTEPNSGAVVDSLGWAYYRLGRYLEAVEQLERACQLEPSDAEINTHLGDAYWRVGRKVEAQFQWRKVLTTMAPEEMLKAGLESRLKAGLADGPAAKVAGR